MSVKRLFQIADQAGNVQSLRDTHVYVVAQDKQLSEVLASMDTDLASVKTMVNDFLNGEADGGTIDRLVELVAAINANKDSIDAFTGANGSITNLQAAVESINTAITALEADSHTHANKAALDAIAVNETTGNYVLNGHEVTGETGIAIGATLEAATNYTGKIRIVFEEFDPDAAA